MGSTSITACVFVPPLMFPPMYGSYGAISHLGVLLSNTQHLFRGQIEAALRIHLVIMRGANSSPGPNQLKYACPTQ